MSGGVSHHVASAWTVGIPVDYGRYCLKLIGYDDGEVVSLGEAEKVAENTGHRLLTLSQHFSPDVFASKVA